MRRELLRQYTMALREATPALQRVVHALDQVRRLEQQCAAAGLDLPLAAPDPAPLAAYGKQASEALGDYSMTLEGVPDHRAVRRAVKAEKFRSG